MQDITTLVPHPKNPNQHPKKQIEILAKIMRHQGWRLPITVSALSGHVVSGHGRLLAAELNGWKEVPVDVQDFESEEDELAHLVADNKISELSNADYDIIKDIVNDLGPDLDFELFGIGNFVDIDLINKGDEAEEWAKTDDVFEPGNNYIKLTYIFKNERERDEYVARNNVDVKTKRTKNSWLVYP